MHCYIPLTRANVLRLFNVRSKPKVSHIPAGYSNGCELYNITKGYITSCSFCIRRWNSRVFSFKTAKMLNVLKLKGIKQ